MSGALYNRDILALAVGSVDFPPREDARHRVSARAPLCGSAILLDVDTGDDGRVSGIGMHVEHGFNGMTNMTDPRRLEIVKYFRNPAILRNLHLRLRIVP